MIEENVFESIVCETAVILSLHQCVKSSVRVQGWLPQQWTPGWHVSSFNLLIVWNFVYFQVCFLHLMRIVTITLTSRRWLVGYQPVVGGPWRRGRNVSHGGSFQLMLWWCKPVSVSHTHTYIYIRDVYIYTFMWNLNLVVIMPTIRLLQCPGNQCC